MRIRLLQWLCTAVLWQKIADYEFPRALLFHPAIPVFPLANRLGLSALVLTAVAFAESLTRLKSQPLLCIPSITDGNPGSASL